MLAGRRTYSKWLIRGLVLFAAAMTVLAAVASREHNSTIGARDSVLSQYVGLEARNLQSSDPALAMQLALIAHRMFPTPAARSALLDVTAGEMPTRLLGPIGETGLALGDDGHRLAIAYQSAGQVKIYALKEAQLTWLSTVPAGSRTARVDAVAISPSGKLLAVGVSAGRVALWSLASPSHPAKLATLHTGTSAVRGLSFSPGGASLAAAEAGGGVQRWSLSDPHQPAPAPQLVAPGGIALEAVSYSHTGNTLSAVGAHGTVVSWDAHGGSAPLAVVRDGGATLTALTYSPDGRWLAVGSRDGRTLIWRLNGRGRAGGAPTSLSGHGNTAALAFSRDSRYLAAASGDRTARIWSTSGWAEVASLPHPAAVTGVAFSDGDRRLLSSDVAGTTVIWQVPPPSTNVVTSAVTRLTFSLTRPQLEVTTQDGATQRWDVVNEWRPTPAGAWDATPPSSAPANAYWLSTATTTATTPGTTTSGTTTVPVNPDAGANALKQTRATTPVVTSLLSPNGQLFVAAGANGLVYLWKVADPSDPQLATTLSGPRTPITQLALSPDGHTLAVATAGGHVWLYGVATVAKAYTTATLTAAPGKITALAFSPSDETLVAGSSDGRLTFWHFRPYLAINRICALSGTPITRSEWRQYVPQHSYNPPCANWTPPAPPQLPKSSG